MKRTGPMLRKTPLARCGRLNPVSRKRRAEQRIYTGLRRDFLIGHPHCVCGQLATEVHHKRGRVGALYLDTDHWVALCHSCHQFLTEHPAFAVELGLSERRTGTSE